MYSGLRLCIFFYVMASISARRFQPLMADNDDSNRRNTRPAECQFGKTLRELGSTWNADLGPPFGVMYCIKCECVPVIKRRRVIARAQCRNIKNECPKIECDEPVQLAGTCCKVCPPSKIMPSIDTEIAQDLPIDTKIGDAENQKQYYGTLMTYRTSMFMKKEEIKTNYVIENPLNIVATGRFIVEQKNLYFSFYISNKADRPRAIQFVDDTGYILQEIILVQPKRGPISVYQNVTGKVCGIWRRIPPEYHRMLDEAKIHIVMLWGGKYQAELALGGKISPYPSLDTEMLSSLLEPTSRKHARIMNGAGGTASISIISKTSLRIVLILNGLFTVQDISNVSLHIHLEEIDTNEKLLTETVLVQKPASDYNVIDFRLTMDENIFKLLTRGKVLIIVQSRRRPKALRIQGPILTRTTCELFETLLTSNSPNGSSGFGWMYFNRDGSLLYNVQTEERSPFSQIQLVDKRNDRNISQMSSEEAFIDHLEPNDFLSLYNSQLAIKISGNQSMKGQLIGQYVADARESNQPFLLYRINENANAMAWMSIDNECTLHYSVVMNNAPINQSLTLELEEKPIEAPGAPVTTTILEEFTGRVVNGFILSMPSHELIKLDTNICYILVRVNDEILVKGKIRPPRVPRHCQPINADNVFPMIPNDDAKQAVVVTNKKCFHSGRFFDEGAQWRNANVTCNVCSCSQSNVKCESIKCPALLCSTKNIVQPKNGECCPSCAPEKLELKTNTTHNRGCDFGGQFHSAGTSWHPYLPPNGFDMCTICTCDTKKLNVQCPRLQCPPLNCTDGVAYRPSPKACCKICPIVKNENKTIDTEFVGDELTFKFDEDEIKSGGCKVANSIYENGREWHPFVSSLGEQQCVSCQCKDSKVTCTRKQCNRTGCKNTNENGKQKCCTVNCRRIRRNQRKEKAEKQMFFKTASSQIRKFLS